MHYITFKNVLEKRQLTPYRVTRFSSRRDVNWRHRSSVKREVNIERPTDPISHLQRAH